MDSYCFLCPRHMECDYLVGDDFPGEVCDRTEAQLAEYREIERRMEAAAIADPHPCEDCMHGPQCALPSGQECPHQRSARCERCGAVLVIGEECMPGDESGLCNPCFTRHEARMAEPSLCGEGAMSIDDWVLYHAPEE